MSNKYCFSDISDDEILSDAQLIEGCAGISDELRNEFSVSNDELIRASQTYDTYVGDCTANRPIDVANGLSGTFTTPSGDLWNDRCAT